MLVMALLAQALQEHIFAPNYLLEDDDELRYIITTMADTEKKTLLRGILLSISEDDARKETVKAARVTAAIEETLEPLQTLIPAELEARLKANLEEAIGKAATAWEHLQRSQSHYESSTLATRASWEWLSIQAKDGGELVQVHSSAFEEDEVLMVVFPRACAIDRSKKPVFTPAFPGIVFQKSQTMEVTESTSEVDNASPATTPAPEEPAPAEGHPEPTEDPAGRQADVEAPAQTPTQPLEDPLPAPADSPPAPEALPPSGDQPKSNSQVENKTTDAKD